MKPFLHTLFVLASLLACVGMPATGAEDTHFVVHYAVQLTEVTCDKPCGYVQPIAADKFHDINGVPYVRYRYTDDVMNITWSVSDNAFDYNLINKTDSVMAIHTNRIFARDWDDRPTSFGYALERPWRPAIWRVPAGTVASGFLIPLDNYPSKPLLPSTFSTRKRAEREGRKHIGKTFRMLLPLMVGNDVYNYRFTFVASGVSAITEEDASDAHQPDADEPAVVRDSEIQIYTPRITQKETSAAAPVAPLRRRSNAIYSPLLASKETPTGPLVDILKRVAFMSYFGSRCPQEKVYLHLDNTAYFQGETIWYAAYVVDAATGGEAASKVLYVELLSPTGVVLRQQKLKVTDGRCHGSFPLIDTDVEDAVALRGAVGYPSGYYQIRAYTRAMLNFDDVGIFSRVIPVYKAPDEEGNYANPVMRQYSGMGTDRPEPSKADRPKKLNVQFFPEGGHLIAGAECRVAFKATDEHGHGVTIDGMTIVNSKSSNSQIVNSKSSNSKSQDGGSYAIDIPLQHGGMGSFLVLASDETNARDIVVRYDGNDYTFALPKAESKGCALRIDHAADDQLSVTVTARALKADSVLAYTITNRGRVCAFDTLHLSCPPEPERGPGVVYTSFSIPKEYLPVGVCQFTLYNPAGDIYAQRLFFVDGDIPTETVTVTAEKADIRPFDEIRLNLQVETSPQPSPKGKGAVSGGNQVTPPLGGDGGGYTFSLAVRDAADYGTAYRDDIRTYMLLSSELKGLIEEPGWYFEENYKIRNEELGIIPADGANSAPSNLSPLSSNPISNSSFLIPNSSDRKAALDLLMLVQGWTRYNWRQMAGVEPFEIRHYTESQLVVDGWAFSRLREKPLEGVKIGLRLTSLDRQHQQETTVTTDSLGYWSVGVEDFEGEWDLYMETRQQNDNSGNKTTRIRLERSSKPDLYAYTPLETWLPTYTWNPDSMLTVEKAGDSEYQLPTESHLLDEVEITGRRKYLDFYTFKAFDAAKDAELMIDEGKYTSKVEDYLREKGYKVQVSTGDVGNVLSNDDYDDLDAARLEYFTKMVEAAPINDRRTFWYIHEGKVNRTAPSFFAGYALDLEEVKSIIVYDDPFIYETFPGITELLTPEELREVVPQNAPGFAPGLYVVDIELNPARKRRTFVDKNARSTSFSGYTPVVEFYAPTYPNGPIQGDKDYRRTIYWNPAVTTDADGHASVSFYNNGYSRALTISAEGLTSDGVPIVN